MGADYAAQLRNLAAEVDGEFARNRKLHRKAIRCGDGCTDCCHQLFSITELEANAISEAASRLPAETREAMMERARAYLISRQKLFGEHGYVEARGNLLPEPLRLICPALEEGRCVLYADRPLLCRKYGMPILQPHLDNRVFACQRNFRTGQPLADHRLVQIQSEIARSAATLHESYLRPGGLRSVLPISVADAIVR